MNKIYLQIRQLYGKVGRAERLVADRILSLDKGEIPDTISSFAAKCGCSEATVVRFSRRLGFSGYRELKLALAAEGGMNRTRTDIDPSDDCSEIFEKLCAEGYVSLENTLKTISASAMNVAAKILSESRRVIVIGLGASGYVAISAASKLMRSGCDAVAYSDIHMQAVAVSQLKQGDVLLAFSQSGCSRDIVDAARSARGRGVFIVSVTARERSALARASDIVLLTESEDVPYGKLGLRSHISRMILVDAICYKIVFDSRQRSEQLGRSEAELKSKRIDE